MLTSVAGTDAQTLCINSAITNITYSTTGATGASFSGLPAGVSGNWVANVVTISGTPTVSGTFNYTVTLTGGCGNITANGSIISDPENTILLTSVAGTDAQTLCINSAITNITYSTTGATGASFSGLPAGVTGNWAANVVTISGSPTASGTLNYTVTLTGGCGAITTNGSISVTANNTVSFTSAVGTDAQTVCINTAITNITYATTGATGASFSGLPAGVTGNWAANVITISGTPTAGGTFNYTVTTTGGCTTPPVTANGSITVTPNNTISLTSVAGTNAQVRCINVAVTNITYSTTGATGASFSGLPAGVTGNWAANVVTISGTPSVNGTFNYTVTLTGGCGNISAAGSITVTANNTITRTSAAGTDAQTRCINTAITNITYSTTGATGASFSGLPAGVIGNWAGNTVTIGGTPTVSGTFNYTVTTTGGCTTPAVTATGTITVTANNTITLTSAAGTNSQAVCINSAIVNISYSTTGATGANFSGLPAGVTGNWAGNVVTVSGTPTVSGTFNYTVTLTGGCGTITANGSITVYNYPTAAGVTVCQNGSGTLTSSAACAAGIPGTAGPAFAGTGVTSNTAGTGWSNPGNVVSNNNAYATINNMDDGDNSEGLVARNFGFTIPANASIAGVQVTISRFGEISNVFRDDVVQLVVGGINVGNNRASVTGWSNVETAVNYGSASDLWGTTLTPAQVNASNFGVWLAVECYNGANNRDPFIDYIQITISYTTPGSLNWYTASTGGTAFGNGTPFNPVGVAGSGLPNTATAGTTTFYAECAAAPGCRTGAAFTIIASPTLANAGTDQNNCTNGNFTLAANAPINGTGTWTLVSGTASITTASSPTSGVTGVPVGTSATLRWTISNAPCANSTDDVVLTNRALPTASNAGPDQNKCNNGGFTLAANAPAVGTGLWTVVSGTATITTPASPTSAVTGVPVGTSATLRWTISNAPCVATTDDVVLINTPNPTAANAGANQNNCNNGSFTLAGNTPTIGTGVWTVVSGTATITTPASPVSGVTGVPVGTSATLRWTISNAPCAASTDDVVLTNTAVPTVSAAGPDQALCTSTASVTLAANNPVVGTGAWSIVSGPSTSLAQFSSTSNRNATFTPAGGAGTYILRWTISNAPCAASTDDINIVVNPLPTITGTLAVCAGSTTTLTGSPSPAAVNPWISASTSIATVNASGIVTGVAAGTSVITYTNSNGCSNTATVTVNPLPAVSILASPSAVCIGGASTLTATNSGGTNTQTYSGASGTINVTVPESRTTWAGSNINIGGSGGATLAAGDIIEVTLNITHSDNDELDIFLVDPSGNRAMMVSTNNGGNGNGYNGTIRTGATPNVTTAGNVVFTGIWGTEGAINAVAPQGGGNGGNYGNAAVPQTALTGASIDGNWQIRVFDDDNAGGNGTLVNWSISIIKNIGSGNYTSVFSGPATIGAISYSGANNTTATVSVTPPLGANNYTVTTTDATGCSITSSQVTVTVNPLPVANAITGPAAVCVASTISLTPNATGNPTLTYTFASSNNSIATVTNAGVVTGAGAGTVNITYTVTDGNGCSATSAAYPVTVNARPGISFTSAPGAAICASTDVTYTTQAGQSNYIWTVPGINGTDYTIIAGGIGASNITVTLQWLTAGSKTVTVNYTNSNGCTGASAASNTTTVNARPTPTFTVQPGASVCATEGVNTYDIIYTTQAGQTNYIWNVPGVAGVDYTIVAGGTGTTNSTVTVRWLTTGNKTVTVNYTNSNGCTALVAASNTSLVNALPVVNTSASSVCVNSTINATPNSAGTWVSSNNGFATIDNTGLITGISAGSVTFTYTFTATGCARTTSPVTVNPLPVIAPISGGAPAICVNDITIFSNATPGGTWSIVNGTGTASIDASGLVTGLSAGNVTVVYTFSNGTCSNSVSVLLTINPIPLVAAIGGGSAFVCVNANTPAFTNATPGGNWSVIDGSGSATVNGSGVVTGVSAGTVTVVYTVDNGTCSNESAVALTINPLPAVAVISGGAPDICVGSSTPAFTNATAGGVWSIISGTGTASITIGGVVTGLTSGSVTVAYTVSNGTCSNTATQALTINPLPVIAAIGGGAASVCIGSVSPAFTNATALGVWSVINGTGTASINGAGVLTGLTAGTVTVVYTVTTGSGCTDFVTTAVTVNSLPVANAVTGANTVCAASVINLNSNATGTPVLTYTWASDNGNAAVTNAGVVTGLAAGTSNITYTVTDGNNCSATSPSFVVNINPRPSANITSANTVICDGSTVNITGTVTATGAWTLTLSNGAVANGTGNGTFSISVTPGITEVYTVTSLNDVNCASIAADLTGSTTVTVNDDVIITAQPVITQTACSGNSVSITVAATGTGLTYQWRKGVTPLVDGGNISGANSAILVLNPVATGDAAADYNVVVSGTAPCAAVTSDNSALLVNEAVNITTQPITQTQCSGNSVSFTVTATGSGLAYQWRRNGSPLADGGDISGVNTTTLNIANLTAANAGDYTVVVSGLAPCNAVTSNIAVLTVNTAVSIDVQPADTVAVCATFPATFTVSASGTGLTYQWYRGTFPGTIVFNNANISGANTATLQIIQANVSDVNDYYVVVSGQAPCTSVRSDYTHLSVDQTITITDQPVSQTVCTGSDAQFTVVATAGPDPLNYQWRKGGIDIPGATDDTLNIIGATAADAGVYRVVITGIAGCVTSLSSIVTLAVDPPSAGGTVNADAAVCIGVNSGTLNLTGHTGNVLRWEFSTDGGSLWTPIANTTTFQNYNNLSLVTMYRAVVKSGVCAETNSAAATISFHPVPDVTPAPASQTICSGLNITTIALSGSVPSTSFGWTRDNVGTITGIAASGSGDISGILTNTTLSPVTVTFTITPTANGCIGVSSTASVTVNPSPDAFATPASQTICSGAGISTVVLSSTVPATTFAWTRNNTGTVTGIAASGTGDISGTLSNTTSSPVTVAFTITPTSGDGCLGASATATVVVDPIPNAIATPASQTICSGESLATIALSSAVSGTTYTWTRDNAGTVTGMGASGSGNISGSLTNTTLFPVTVTFTITPSANGCDGTPVTATVLVNPSPDITAIPSAQTICSGNGITTIVLSSTVPSATYTWSRNNAGTVTGIAANGSGNISGNLTNTTNAPVTVTFTISPSAAGCAGTAVTADIIVNPTPTATATPSSQTICSGPVNSIVLTGTVAGTTYGWTRNNTGTVTGIAANGSGDITGSLTNTTNALVTVTFSITPTANGCPGTPINAAVGVRPTPTVSVTNNTQTVCGSVAIASMVISNPNTVAGTSFGWTRNNTTDLTGIAASGSGSPITGTLVNNTSVQQVTTFTITATANTCASSTTATITVNPRPVMTSRATDTVCNNSAVNIPLTSIPAATYTWVAGNNANVTGESTTNQSTATINNTLVNTSASPGGGQISLTPRQNVTYTVTPVASGTGCAGVPQTVTVTVNPSYNISYYEYPNDDNLFVICDGDLVGGGGQNDMDLIEGQYSGVPLLWQYSIGSNTGPWNTVPGPHVNNAIHDTLPPPPSIFSPMGNYYFRLLVGGCASDILTMTKTSTLTIEAGVDKSTCQSGSPAAITLSGSTVGGTASTTVGGTWSINSLVPANGGVNGTLSSTAFRTSSPNTIQTVTYTPPVNYSGVVTLWLTSNDPDGNGPCGPLVDSVRIFVTQAPIVANASTMAICSGENTSIALTSVIPSTYTWTVGTVTGGITGAIAGAGNDISQVLINPSTSAAGTVQYVITPTPISPATCPAVTSSITVTVRPLPAPSLSRSPATVCSGTASVLTATNTGGTLSTTLSGINNTVQGISSSGTPTITSSISLPAGTITAASAITLSMNLTHSFAGDLRVTLISPSCGSTVLFNRPGGNSNNDNLLGTYTFVSSGGATFPANTDPITAQTYNATFTGITFPCNSSAGNWTLQIEDLSNLDGGALNFWSLSINGTGVYTSVFNGPATIGSVSYSGANNTTATASVTGPVGVNNYTVTSTDAFGCIGTSSSVSVTVNPPPTLTGAVQAASVCAGSQAQIDLAGLVASSTSSITYRINGGPTQTVTNVLADAAGNASFNTIALTSANNGQTLQITSLTTTNPLPACAQLLTQNITLSVNPTPTLTGASQQSDVCAGSSAQINLSGLIPSTIITATYTINGGPVETVTNISVSAGGTANFTTIGLTAANDGQVLQVTGITITSALPNCSQSFTRNVTLDVHPIPALSSSLSPGAICSGSTFSYAPSSALPGSSFAWSRSVVAGISQPANSGTGNINEILTNTTSAPVSVNFLVTTTANGCNNSPGENVVLVVNPAPSLSTVSQAATVCAGTGGTINLTGLIPNSTSTVFYSINGISQPSVAGVVSNGSGNASFTSANLTVANNGQVLRVTGVSNTSNSPTCARTFSIITLLSVNANPTLTGATQPVPVCVAGPATISITGLVPGSTNNTINYTINGVAQTPVTGVNANGSGAASFITSALTVANNGQTLQVTGITNGTCSQSFTQNVLLSVGTINTWLGINSNWFDPLNWCAGIPTSTTDVLIPGSLSFYPLVSSGVPTVRNISIQPTASVTLSAAVMQIAGSITNTGVFDASAGAIELNGISGVQNISGSSFAARTLGGLIISNTAGVNVSSAAGDTLNIADSLAFGNVNNAVLNTGDNITLLSRAAKTARVSNITNGGVNTGNSFSGKVTIERFIPQRRAWRLLTVPLQQAGSQTFNAAWQEGVVNPDFVYANRLDPHPGFGTLITGPAGANGFDPSPMNNYSIQRFDPLAAAWSGIPNTHTLKVTDSAGYMVFVRGDRSTQIYLNTLAPTSHTILRTNGFLKTNLQTTAVPAGIGPFSLVGNPYPSSIDLRQVSTTGGVSGVNYVVWDPSLTGTNGVGAYQYLTRSGGPGSDYLVFPGNSALGGGSYGAAFSVNNTIQSSQAFFVQNAGAGSVGINENAKIVPNSSTVFRPMTPRRPAFGYISTLLMFENGHVDSLQLVDGALMMYNDNYSDAIDLEDARKMQNFSSENFGILSSDHWMQIEKRSRIADADTIFFKAKSYRVRDYQFHIEADNIQQPGLTAFLEDSYLQTATPVSLTGTTVYRFKVTADSGAWKQDRFRIVFRSNTVLPVTFSSVKAYKINDDVNVEWKTAHESSVASYEVEKSVDGTRFEKTYTEVNVKNNERGATYQWLDKNPVKGYNYYRIRSNDVNGDFKYTAIVKVMFDKATPLVTLYPNPLADGTFNLYFTNMPGGEYKLRLMNTAGQLIDAAVIQHAVTTSKEVFKPRQQLLQGNYMLEIIKPDGTKQTIRAMY
ncbi:MAG TPA: proprotein convertase P-domain-containing protein [Ferruginibacter sp.]|nr:proprotein convertase P-domain-containing protein [Ferruginibacter sp.]